MKNLWRKIRKNLREMKERERLFPEEYVDIGKNPWVWLVFLAFVVLFLRGTHLLSLWAAK